jgi:hypothetical protein
VAKEEVQADEHEERREAEDKEKDEENVVEEEKHKDGHEERREAEDEEGDEEN